MNNSEGNILSFIAGVAIGALIGILVAPDKGQNTRGKIAKKSNELVSDLEERIDAAKNELEKFAASVRRSKADVEAGSNESAEA
ncbi:MAG: YtxH domain-containing protein [Cytophagales bacterium]|nr:MAG: YtxH domain-containing protein [Cytophagales bacterium]TAF61398.1 MAG: YtxH domain-containing protein [Cytophagales bacterium]